MGNTTQQKMRVYHRYLGFFLAGIMAVYAISGIVLIFRNTDAFKREVKVELQVAPGLAGEALGKAIKIRRFKADSTANGVVYFKNGTYNSQTGQAVYTKKELPLVLDKLTHMHKATTNSPLFFLNIFFGAALFFFVLSAFWMFMPNTKVFKKAIYFTLAGIVLTLIMVLV